MSAERISLEASQVEHAAGLDPCPDPPPSQQINASILVRRRPDTAAQHRVEAILRGEAPPMSRQESTQILDADASDLQATAAFAKSYGLNVIESSPVQRVVKVSGTVAQMEAAFGVKLRCSKVNGKLYICYEGALSIPASLQQTIVGVLGLDQRPAARV